MPYRYNVKRADGRVCCSGNDRATLCPACRATVDGCGCENCRNDRSAGRAAVARVAPAATTTRTNTVSAAPLAATAASRTAASPAPVPGPPSLLDAVRAFRGNNLAAPIEPPHPAVRAAMAAPTTTVGGSLLDGVSRWLSRAAARPVSGAAAPAPPDLGAALIARAGGAR